jgi:hypothetical protein
MVRAGGAWFGAIAARCARVLEGGDALENFEHCEHADRRGARSSVAMQREEDASLSIRNGKTQAVWTCVRMR